MRGENGNDSLDGGLARSPKNMSVAMTEIYPPHAAE
jgi:hypothetical protein